MPIEGACSFMPGRVLGHNSHKKVLKFMIIIYGLSFFAQPSQQDSNHFPLRLLFWGLPYLEAATFNVQILMEWFIPSEVH